MISIIINGKGKEKGADRMSPKNDNNFSCQIKFIIITISGQVIYKIS